ncbi:uncharacterized protein PHALS_11827 [Plasmopara halstedii]|uniref:Uncharacterized protein n=1 Tax=Plasmopara halstedii TaxID=4781 RepID=A0A0P1AJS8_PLAHL|nr:uncharacterized protein PHALS_11827 [Plasmopara halstedii]CEG41485.1 hypothetical protein PHALS_11827 [Plasmopara halstedii]|eukprot:XP_024577854.1 hypothetical protein PHALS_11827 [Plasmopara halstedii]
MSADSVGTITALERVNGNGNTSDSTITASEADTVTSMNVTSTPVTGDKQLDVYLFSSNMNTTSEKFGPLYILAKPLGWDKFLSAALEQRHVLIKNF